MYRFSNSVIGYLNLLTLLSSIPIIAGALWLARSSATCESALETTLLAVGFIILLVSLAGFIGACFNVAWALWLYLFAMFLLIFALLCITCFGFAVTGGGGGVQVSGRMYSEYHLGDYSAWLRSRITEERYWRAAVSCVVGSNACAEIVRWTPLDYMQRDLTPIQSGCCKPPTSCTYEATAISMAEQEEDCYRWNNAANILCYGCDSCKAGVLEQVRRDWHKLSVLNVVVVIFVIAVYALGCCAFRNARRSISDHPHGDNRMSKIRPQWDHYWGRWWQNRRDQLW
ncbi:tetraspanin-6 isoform X2 [Dendrobium catenatum]|uniref:tetraspanin-6 isoform X2 n=1 Tax=Dendrobium catenatum TaxID=906689 RepID=UPI0009F435F2|nr:tetraspanin-6 isoform X2 [Dendrobium catenatum]